MRQQHMLQPVLEHQVKLIDVQQPVDKETNEITTESQLYFLN